MQRPKVVVIGAGSLFFGRQAIWQMAHSPHLQGGTLALVDSDAHRMQQMAALARKAVEHARVPLAIESATDHRQVLDGADFVVLSFARESVRYRGIDCQVSAKYGVRMCSGDTIGPGGIFRTLRELPVIMKVVDDIRRQCPDAWVINYINPSTVHGIALMRFAPWMKSFALCDGLHMPHIKKRYAMTAGIIGSLDEFTPQIDREFDMRIAGPNHFTWMLKAEYQGQDVMPRIARRLQQEAIKEDAVMDVGAKRLHNNRIAYALYDVYGKVPTCVGHTKEYVRFWQGRGVSPEPLPPLKLWETEDRYKLHEKMWQQVGEYVSGKVPIDDFMTRFGPDHATDIIENMWGGLGKPFYVNTANRGAVPNMADDAFLELLCDMDMNGVRPRPVGPVPRGLRAAMEQILDTHELTAEAAVTCRRDILRRALITDPLTNTIGDTDAIIAALLEAQRDVLPEGWYSREPVAAGA
jgi:alpha-galactosidase